MDEHPLRILEIHIRRSLRNTERFLSAVSRGTGVSTVPSASDRIADHPPGPVDSVTNLEYRRSGFPSERNPSSCSESTAVIGGGESTVFRSNRVSASLSASASSSGDSADSVPLVSSSDLLRHLSYLRNCERLLTVARFLIAEGIEQSGDDQKPVALKTMSKALNVSSFFLRSEKPLRQLRKLLENRNPRQALAQLAGFGSTASTGPSSSSVASRRRPPSSSSTTHQTADPQRPHGQNQLQKQNLHQQQQQQQQTSADPSIRVEMETFAELDEYDHVAFAHLLSPTVSARRAGRSSEYHLNPQQHRIPSGTPSFFASHSVSSPLGHAKRSLQEPLLDVSGAVGPTSVSTATPSPAGGSTPFRGHPALGVRSNSSDSLVSVRTGTADDIDGPNTLLALSAASTSTLHHVTPSLSTAVFNARIFTEPDADLIIDRYERYFGFQSTLLHRPSLVDTERESMRRSAASTGFGSLEPSGRLDDSKSHSQSQNQLYSQPHSHPHSHSQAHLQLQHQTQSQAPALTSQAQFQVHRAEAYPSISAVDPSQSAYEDMCRLCVDLLTLCDELERHAVEHRSRTQSSSAATTASNTSSATSSSGNAGGTGSGSESRSSAAAISVSSGTARRNANHHQPGQSSRHSQRPQNSERHEQHDSHRSLQQSASHTFSSTLVSSSSRNGNADGLSRVRNRSRSSQRSSAHHDGYDEQSDEQGSNLSNSSPLTSILQFISSATKSVVAIDNPSSSSASMSTGSADGSTAASAAKTWNPPVSLPPTIIDDGEPAWVRWNAAMVKRVKAEQKLAASTGGVSSTGTPGTNAAVSTPSFLFRSRTPSSALFSPGSVQDSTAMSGPGPRFNSSQNLLPHPPHHHRFSSSVIDNASLEEGDENAPPLNHDQGGDPNVDFAQRDNDSLTDDLRIPLDVWNAFRRRIEIVAQRIGPTNWLDWQQTFHVLSVQVNGMFNALQTAPVRDQSMPIDRLRSKLHSASMMVVGAGSEVDRVVTLTTDGESSRMDLSEPLLTNPSRWPSDFFDFQRIMRSFLFAKSDTTGASSSIVLRSKDGSALTKQSDIASSSSSSSVDDDRVRGAAELPGKSKVDSVDSTGAVESNAYSSSSQQLRHRKKGAESSTPAIGSNEDARARLLNNSKSSSKTTVSASASSGSSSVKPKSGVPGTASASSADSKRAVIEAMENDPLKRMLDNVSSLKKLQQGIQEAIQADNLQLEDSHDLLRGNLNDIQGLNARVDKQVAGSFRKILSTLSTLLIVVAVFFATIFIIRFFPKKS